VLAATHAKHGIEEARLRTVQGDQGDPEFLAAFAEGHGPFDVIVDDGSTTTTEATYRRSSAPSS
jgi:hypothetical protein